MSRKETIAILMGLAPEPPRDFEHVAAPKAPTPREYLGHLEAQAARFQYVQEGDKTSLVQAAYGLAEWFADARGEYEMDADGDLEEAAQGVLLLHPETDRAALSKTVLLVKEALRKFETAYLRYAMTAGAWKSKRDLVWRRQWAERIYRAAPNDEPVEVVS